MYEILQNVLRGFLMMITVVSLLAAVGFPLPLTRLVLGSVGMLIAVLGNYMGKLTRNFFVGIRTPWTLVSDAMWYSG